MIPASDRFKGQYAPDSGPVTGPATRAFVPTLSDTIDLTLYNDGATPFFTRSIYVGGVGNLKVILEEDTVAVTLPAVPAGTFVPVRAKRIFSIGTTATSLVVMD